MQSSMFSHFLLLVIVLEMVLFTVKIVCFRVAKELAELEAKGDVGLDQFLEFTRTHHSLLWPAFQMQLALKKKMIGIGFWQTHAERRVKLTKNKYVKIKDLLQLVSWCLSCF